MDLRQVAWFEVAHIDPAHCVAPVGRIARSGPVRKYSAFGRPAGRRSCTMSQKLRVFIKYETIR
jgi:hypothetical protein